MTDVLICFLQYYIKSSQRYVIPRKSTYIYMHKTYNFIPGLIIMA